MTISIRADPRLLEAVRFPRLFVEELGWSNPTSPASPLISPSKDRSFDAAPIAELAGVVVFEIEAADGTIPDAKLATRRPQGDCPGSTTKICSSSSTRDRTQSLWYWVKREDGKLYPRDHLYLKGQPGDLFLSKLGQIVFDLGELDAEGNVAVVEVAGRLRKALDVERVTKRFYDEFERPARRLPRTHPRHRRRAPAALVRLGPAQPADVHLLPAEEGLPRRRRSGLPARQARTESQERGKDRYLSAISSSRCSSKASPSRGEALASRTNALLGNIKYLNGGLFLPHRVEQDNPDHRTSPIGLREPLRPLRPLFLEPRRHARRQGRRDQPRRAGLHLREVHQPEGVRRLLHPHRRSPNTSASAPSIDSSSTPSTRRRLREPPVAGIEAPPVRQPRRPPAGPRRRPVPASAAWTYCPG